MERKNKKMEKKKDKTDDIQKVLEVTKGKDSHVSIYVFDRTGEEIKEFHGLLPKGFAVEEYPGEDYRVFRAEEFAGFEYVEVTVYPKEETEK